MLIRFATANHRSIKDRIELSLVAVDRDRPAVRSFDRLHEGLLPLAAIYGANASGKSNVLDALSWLTLATRLSLRAWDDEIPREPFRFAGYDNNPSLFEVDFIHDGIRHIYTLELDDRTIHLEELVSFPERRPRTLFTREHLEVHFRRGIANSLGMRELISPVTLVLSIARRFDVPELRGPAQFIANISTPLAGRSHRVGIGRKHTGYEPIIYSTRRLFLDAYRAVEYPDESPGVPGLPFSREDDLQVARSLLRFADLGIDDVEVVEQQDEALGRSRLDLRFVHRARSEKASFHLSEESDGTQMWFRLIGPALAALRSGRPLLLDEIDSSLHPLLSSRLLQLFRDPKTNPQNSQLIFTTHDTTLMSELNRDEVWFTEKDEDGATSLMALAEFGGDRVRRSLNLERAYLQGRFGGLPNLRDSALLDVRPAENEHPAGSDDKDQGIDTER